MLRNAGRDGCLTNFFILLFRQIHLNSKGLFRHLRARGNLVCVWVVNTNEELRELHELYGDQVDGFMTDAPTVLKDFVENDLKC